MEAGTHRAAVHASKNPVPVFPTGVVHSHRYLTTRLICASLEGSGTGYCRYDDHVPRARLRWMGDRRCWCHKTGVHRPPNKHHRAAPARLGDAHFASFSCCRSSPFRLRRMQNDFDVVKSVFFIADRPSMSLDRRILGRHPYGWL